MTITNKMIDKDLRFRAIIDRIISNEKTVEEYVKEQEKRNKLLKKLLYGKNINGLNCSEKWINHGKLRLRIYKPLNAKENAPGILWIHGGGYSMGIPELFSSTYKRLIEWTNCVIIAPDYTLSTEAPYPAALFDCYESLLWMKNNASELGIRDDQIIVGGESAGGGLSAALCIYARDKGEVNIAFQVPLYPMIDDSMITESSRENDAPYWNSNLNRCAWQLYLGELFERDVPKYAAAARETDYRNLPPAITFVGDIEPFRDETIEYVDNLRKAGVKVAFRVVKGCYHGFDIICPKAKVSQDSFSFLKESIKYAIDNFYSKQQ